MADFKEALEYVLKNEGGFVVDNGGPTNFGITMPILAFYRNGPVTEDDIKNLKYEEVEAIYKKLFWDFMKLDQISQQPIATAIFDAAVNRSCSTAIKLAQRVANLTLGSGLEIDGILGPLGSVAINSVSPNAFVRVMVEQEHAANLAIVAHKPELEKYLKGWDNRAQRLLTLI